MRTILRLLAAFVVVGTLLGAGWWAIPIWFSEPFVPAKRVPAEYEPPAGKTILVLVDDALRPVDYEPVKAQLTEMLNEQLVAHKVAAKTIPYSRLGEFMSATPTFNSLAVSEIGQKLGAEMVLYVQIDDFGLHDPAAGAETWKGRLATTVRLVDVVKGRLWPTDGPAGRTVPRAETQTVSDSSQSRGELVSKELAAETAERIARLFCAFSMPHEGACGDKSKPTLDN